MAALAAAIMLGLVLGLTPLQRWFLFPRHFARPVPGADRAAGLQRWWLDIPEGRVETWFLPGRGVDADRPGPAVIFTHGNAELIDHWPRMLAPYRELGVSVVLPEYRGYGRSDGAPSEAGLRDDLRRVIERVRSHPFVDPARLVYHGRSLGGGVICGQLDHAPPRALVLESTFTSVVDAAAEMWVPPFLITDRLECLEALRRYEGPLLVFHGVRDRVVPVSHGRRLAETRPTPPLVLYDCGHNDLPPAGSDYWERIERHLRDSGVLP